MSGKRKNSNRDLQIDSNTAVAVHVYKKAKQAPPPPKLPTERLCLSALRWVGEPRIWNADGNAPVRYGAYVAVRRKGTDPAYYLFPSMWSAEHRAFVYKARRKSGLRFTYKRSSFIGTTGSSITYYGGIFGEADEQDPLFLVHRPILPDAKASAFKAVYDENWTDEERDENTPPFYFSTGGQDEVVSAVPESQVINLDMPDLRCTRRRVRTAWMQRTARRRRISASNRTPFRRRGRGAGTGRASS
ncbi:hypothetical protein DFH11DRAFT_877133 [Phellopilus nigrolimitatus]|nr:hypothetical protein DFH11DRAFT_877133 [Phellopilus nigrolimitatus]